MAAEDSNPIPGVSLKNIGQNEPIPRKLKGFIPKFSLVNKLCIILAVISILVYANTMQNQYALDDIMMIEHNDYVQAGIKGIPQLLVTPHLKGYAPDLTDTYRPLSLVMFAIEYQFWGLNPSVNHFFSVLVFAGCVLMLFLFLNKLFDGQRTSLAFIASLLFAVHPIHTEVVANIKSRDELLCFFFAFLSLNIFINYARKGKLYQLIAGACCLFLSIISKETSSTFIAVIPLIFFFYKNENKKRSILITGATIIVIAAFLIIRAVIINKYKADGMIKFTLIDNALIGAPTTASHIATAILILGHYLKLLVIPYPLICDYSYNSIPYVGFGNVWVLVSLSAYICLVICGFYRLFKNKKDPWALGILLFLITISLFTNIPFVFGATQADRLIFFASAGSCLLIALVIEKWVLRSQEITILKNRKAQLLFAICIVYSIVTVSRNTDWKDDYTLNTADVAKSPNSTKLNCFLGIALHKKYSEETDPEKQASINNDCIRYLNRSIEILPSNVSAQTELGTAYMLANKFDSAIVHFNCATRLDPKSMNAITNLGSLYSMQGKYTEAIPYYIKTITFQPEDTATWFNLAVGYLHIGKYDSSIIAFNKTIELDPSYNKYASFVNIAAVYDKIGKIDSAKKYEAITKQYYPQFTLEAVKIK